MNHIVKENHRSVGWSALERFGSMGSNFVIGVLLARMLMPADYGAIAMLTIFIAISQSLIDSGLSQALIQRNSRNEDELTTALIFNVVVAFIIYALLFLAAPAIEHFYRLDGLSSVVRWFSLTLVINSLSVVQQSLISMELDFRRLFISSLLGIIAGGGVAIVMAYRGYGLWSLVAQQIVMSGVRTATMWVISDWRPRGSFSRAALAQLWDFGSKIMFSGILHSLYSNLYSLVIGRQFATAELGLFNRATTLGAMPSSNISQVVSRTLYPLLSSQKESVDIASETMLRYLRVTCFAVFSWMVGIAMLSEPLVELLLGAKWLGSAPLLSIVAIAYMFDPVMLFPCTLIKSQGRSADYLRAEVIKKIVGFAILFGSIPFGIEVMCWGLILYALCDIAIILFYSRRIDYRVGYCSVAREILPLLIIALVMGAAIWGVERYIAPWNLAPIWHLLIGKVVGTTIYIGIALAIGRKEPYELYAIAMKFIKKENTKNNLI